MSTNLDSVGLDNQDVEDGINDLGRRGTATGGPEDIEHGGVGTSEPLQALDRGALHCFGLEVGEGTGFGKAQGGAHGISCECVLSGLGQ